MIDLYADENEPVSEWIGNIYSVKLLHGDRENRYNIYVEVDEYGQISIQDHTFFLGKDFRSMSWEERREVYSVLVEWELAEWRSIGPEDSELFATKKLEPK